MSILLTKFINTNQYSYNLRDEVKEEILQEILVKIHNKRHTYDTDYSVSPWLYTIAKHCIIDNLRANKKHQYSDQLDTDQIASNESSIEAQLSSKQELMELFSKLPVYQQQLLIMSKHYGHSGEEISEITNRSIPSIKTGIHRAIFTLKKMKVKNEN